MRPRTERALPLLIVLGLAVAGCGGEPSGTTPTGATSAGTTASPAPTGTTAPPATGTTAPPATGTTAPPTTSSRVSTAPPDAQKRLVAGRYQPLWPFSTQTEAEAWRRAHREDGREAWHLDPGRTAIAFARDYLGFTEIDQAVKTVRDGLHARVHVGFRAEEGPRPLVTAVVHLVRYGSAPDAPWEVVGTDDTSLSLTTPKYGAAVGSPLTVGGRITGVDESIKIQVRRPGKAALLGEQCCLSAGGDDSPWSAKVSFTPDPGRTLTIVASTGGHVADVERFAVTGVTIAR
ncbi:hypothetical protein [Nonomuraea basaltis]|uniref:hypothetical protein n=1 Tax=Nonomuraea basaltis TaxID=2495887 RepID=UPI00110C54C7|nr:hypothetical protein [Nonomuraea basaltis]TMR88372.1 hypothetical protein EJK15_66640 [Nonomuraea basaltis]